MRCPPRRTNPAQRASVPVRQMKCERKLAAQQRCYATRASFSHPYGSSSYGPVASHPHGRAGGCFPDPLITPSYPL
eukprot:59960-Prorocentrum_minimum.AAC.1